MSSGPVMPSLAKPVSSAVFSAVFTAVFSIVNLFFFRAGIAAKRALTQGATRGGRKFMKRQGGGHFSVRAAALSCPRTFCPWGFSATCRSSEREKTDATSPVMRKAGNPAYAPIAPHMGHPGRNSKVIRCTAANRLRDRRVPEQGCIAPARDGYVPPAGACAGATPCYDRLVNRAGGMPTMKDVLQRTRAAARECPHGRRPGPHRRAAQARQADRARAYRGFSR